MSHDCSTPATAAGTHAFDVRGVARRLRAYFGALLAIACVAPESDPIVIDFGIFG